MNLLGKAILSYVARLSSSLRYGHTVLGQGYLIIAGSYHLMSVTC